MDSAKKTYEQQYYEKLVYDMFLLEFEMSFQEERIEELRARKNKNEIAIKNYEKLLRDTDKKLEVLKLEMKENFDTDYDKDFKKI